MEGAATIDVSADFGLGFGGFFEFVVFQVRAHVSEADDTRAEMAICGSGSVGEFVCCEARDEGFGGGVQGISFLRDFEVAELTKDKLAGTYRRSVAGYIGRVGGCVRATGTWVGAMQYVVVGEM